MSDILLYYSLLNPFSLVLLFWPTEPHLASGPEVRPSHKHVVAIEFYSQPNEFFIDLSTSFIHYHSRDLHVVARRTVRRVILGENVCVESCLNITAYILVQVFNCHLLSKTVSVCEEKLYAISLLLLDAFLVEVIHQSLADIEDAHSAIDRLIKHQLSSLHVDYNEVFIKYRAMLEVWSRCFLSTND